jgi:hypothetical protein
MTWRLERYHRVGPRGLVDEVDLGEELDEDELRRALGTTGPVRFAEWPVTGPLVDLVRSHLEDPAYLSRLRRLRYEFFLGYRSDESR